MHYRSVTSSGSGWQPALKDLLIHTCVCFPLRSEKAGEIATIPLTKVRVHTTVFVFLWVIQQETLGQSKALRIYIMAVGSSPFQSGSQFNLCQTHLDLIWILVIFSQSQGSDWSLSRGKCHQEQEITDVLSPEGQCKGCTGVLFLFRHIEVQVIVGDPLSSEECISRLQSTFYFLAFKTQWL